MTNKFYITNAIPYVNAKPHIGHALEFVQSDTIARYHREILKQNTLLLCGSDENALKIFQAAEKAGKTPQEFTNLHNQEFLKLAEKLNVQFDIWQRGSDVKKHFPSSQKLWELCEKNGYIYKKSYTGLYCVGCETFYTKEELDENGECFEHPGRKLDKVSEENYFFKLSKYQDFLEDLITSNKLKIIPEIRKNEALAFIRKGLEDFSISRSKERARGWGIPVPGDPDQIMYVWFDALNIYQTGIDFGTDEATYRKWWPQDVMVIGKGIIRFHAVYWPAILQSAGLALPHELFIHGYLTVDGQKMSKTIGNVVDPLEIINKFGTDATRYYLLKEIPSTNDGDFSERRFKELYNADLANTLGNLISRVESLCIKNNFDVTKSSQTSENKLLKKIAPYLENFQFEKALEQILEDTSILNKYINDEKPWEKQTEDATKILDIIIYSNDSMSSIRDIGEALKPFIPNTAQEIIKRFNQPITKSAPLFPRIV